MCCVMSAIEIPFSRESVKTDANLFENFVRIDPDDSKSESLKTRCWLWYDEDALHVEFAAEIDSTFRKGNYYPKDNGQDGDYVRIQIVTIPEAYYSYYYTAAPLGNQSDAVRNADMYTDFQWNSSYSFQTEYSDTLWTTHFVIPFKDMRFSAKPPYQWKVLLLRYNESKQESYSKPYANTKDGKDYFLKAADITLTHQIKRSSDLKFKPYFVKSYDLLTKTDTFDPDNLGMDISFNPSTRTKLKIALNPDFTDIPPDNAQNDYNNRYPPYYSENRFFFTEDLEAFGADYSTFYTRHIVQPQIAVKFTGNSKTLNYGFLGAVDKKIVSNGDIVNHDDYYQMASVIKTLPRFKTFLTTASRMNQDYYNHIACGLWEWELIKKLRIGQSGMFSYKHPRPDDEDTDTLKADLQGSAVSAFIKANPGNWNCETRYSNLSRDFRAEMGTFYETGYENYSVDVTWYADSKEKYLKQWGLSAYGNYQNKLDSRHSFYYRSNSFNTWFQFLPKYSFSTNIYLSCEAYEGKEYEQSSAFLSYSWYKYDSFNCYFSGSIGKSLVYNLQNNYDCNSISGSIAGNISQKLNWSLSLTQYNYAYPRTVVICTDTDTTTVVNDNHYQIGSANLNYNFSNTTTLRNGLSLTSYDADDDYARISFYSNFRYEFKQDCFLYLGYKTGQAQDEQSCWKDPMGHFKRNSASAYLKVSLTI
jgi:hypothetical protein